MKHLFKEGKLVFMILMVLMLSLSQGRSAMPVIAFAGETEPETAGSKEEKTEEEKAEEEKAEEAEDVKTEEEKTEEESGSGEEDSEKEEEAEEEEEKEESEEAEETEEAEEEEPMISIAGSPDKSPSVTLTYEPHRKRNNSVDYYICTITARSNSGKPIKLIQYGDKAAREEWPGGESTTFRFKQNGSMEITVTDGAGYSASVTMSATNVDWFPPGVKSLKFVYDGPVVNGKTHSGYLLAEGPYDVDFEIPEKPYSITRDRDTAYRLAVKPFQDFSVIPPWQAEGRFDISENGLYYLLILDGAENVGYHEIYVKEFDFDGPNVTVNANADEVNGCTKCEEVIFSAADTGAGLVELPFSYDGGKTWTKENRFVVTKNQTFNVTVRDGLDNRTEYKYEVNRNFDNEGPRIEDITEASPLEYKGQVGSVIVDVRADDDGSQVSENGYSFDGGETWQSSHVCELKKNGTYRIKVRDWLGNETTGKEIKVENIDDAPPVISGLEQEFQNSAGGYGKSRLVTVNARDLHSVISGNAYSFDGGETWQGSPEFNARKNGVLQVAVRDLFGNIARSEISVNGIDETPPEITVTGIPEKQVTDPIRLSISVRDGEAGVESLWYKNNTVNIPSILKHFELLNNGGGVVSGSAEAVITVNGDYTIIAYDALGNTSEKTVKVDRIKKKASDSSSAKKKKEESGGSGGSSGNDQRTIVLPPSTGGNTDSGKGGGVISKTSSVPGGNQEFDGGTVHLKGALSEDAAESGGTKGFGGKSRETDGGELFTEDETEITEETQELVLPEEEDIEEPEYEEEPVFEVSEHDTAEKLAKAPVAAEQLIAEAAGEDENGIIGIVLVVAGVVLLMAGAVIFILVKKGILCLDIFSLPGEIREK